MVDPVDKKVTHSPPLPLTYAHTHLILMSYTKMARITTTTTEQNNILRLGFKPREGYLSGEGLKV